MFDVQLEGRTVLDQFDAYARAGPNTPIVWTETVTVTDGILEIRFIARILDPGVNAIEVRR